MRKTVIPPALKGVYEHWHFAPALIADGLIFCSGIIGTSVDGEPPDRDGLRGAKTALAGDAEAPISALQAVRDPKAQFETAFAALEMILAEAGAGLADIVELTSYHVDIARHWETFVAVRDAVLAPPWPAWTAIGVTELAVPGGLVELRAIAEAKAG
jgi:enamine deaminase RidA (YjgF/YER057c/UK114 family)